jgi:protein-disulfide isomerase
MTNVQRIEEQIRKLSPQEFAELREWILEQDWAAWDEQIEADARDGKLNKLADEALDDHKAGRTRPL